MSAISHFKNHHPGDVICSSITSVPLLCYYLWAYKKFPFWFEVSILVTKALCILASSGDWQEQVSGPNSWCWCHDIRAAPRVNFANSSLITGAVCPFVAAVPWMCFCNGYSQSVTRCSMPGMWWSKACQDGTIGKFASKVYTWPNPNHYCIHTYLH